MGRRVRIDGLDGAAACSLCVRLAGDFRARAALAPAGSSVEIETDVLRVSDLLHRLEEWTTWWGLQSIRVDLDGRAYVLEPAVRPNAAGAEELLPSASPAA